MYAKLLKFSYNVTQGTAERVFDVDLQFVCDDEALLAFAAFARREFGIDIPSPGPRPALGVVSREGSMVLGFGEREVPTKPHGTKLLPPKSEP